MKKKPTLKDITFKEDGTYGFPEITTKFLLTGGLIDESAEDDAMIDESLRAERQRLKDQKRAGWGAAVNILGTAAGAAAGIPGVGSAVGKFFNSDSEDPAALGEGILGGIGGASSIAGSLMSLVNKNGGHTRGTYSKTGLLELNGDSHDEASGGIDITEPGSDVQTLVEGGETIFNDFVYTNSRNVEKGSAEQFLLPKFIEGLTFADASKKLAEDYNMNINNANSKKSFEQMMGRLEELHMATVPESRPENQAPAVVNNTVQGAAAFRYGGDYKVLAYGGPKVEKTTTEKPSSPELTVLQNELLKSAYGPNARVRLDPEIATQFENAMKLYAGYRGENDPTEITLGDTYVSSGYKQKRHEEYLRNKAMFEEQGYYINQSGQRVNSEPPKQAGTKSFHTHGKAIDLAQGNYGMQDNANLYRALYESGFRQHPGEWWHWSIGEFDDPKERPSYLPPPAPPQALEPKVGALKEKMINEAVMPSSTTNVAPTYPTMMENGGPKGKPKGQRTLAVDTSTPEGLERMQAYQDSSALHNSSVQADRDYQALLAKQGINPKTDFLSQRSQSNLDDILHEIGQTGGSSSQLRLTPEEAAEFASNSEHIMYDIGYALLGLNKPERFDMGFDNFFTTDHLLHTPVLDSIIEKDEEGSVWGRAMGLDKGKIVDRTWNIDDEIVIPKIQPAPNVRVVEAKMPEESLVNVPVKGFSKQSSPQVLGRLQPFVTDIKTNASGTSKYVTMSDGTQKQMSNQEFTNFYNTNKDLVQQYRISRKNGGSIDPEMMFRDKYNTSLTKSEQKVFDKWAQEESKRRGREILMDMGAYDVQGFWKSGDYKNIDKDGHGTDKWKKPNHPTFSNESIYHDVDGYVGGTWGEDGSYMPSAHTSKLYNADYYDWLFSSEADRPEHLHPLSKQQMTGAKVKTMMFEKGGLLTGNETTHRKDGKPIPDFNSLTWLDDVYPNVTHSVENAHVRVSQELAERFKYAYERFTELERAAGKIGAEEFPEIVIGDAARQESVAREAGEKYAERLSQFNKDGFYINDSGKKVFQKPPFNAGIESHHVLGNAIDIAQTEENKNNDNLWQALHEAGFRSVSNEWWHWSIDEVHMNDKWLQNYQKASDNRRLPRDPNTGAPKYLSQLDPETYDQFTGSQIKPSPVDIALGEEPADINLDNYVSPDDSTYVGPSLLINNSPQGQTNITPEEASLIQEVNQLTPNQLKNLSPEERSAINQVFAAVGAIPPTPIAGSVVSPTDLNVEPDPRIADEEAAGLKEAEDFFFTPLDESLLEMDPLDEMFLYPPGYLNEQPETVRPPRGPQEPLANLPVKPQPRVAPKVDVVNLNNGFSPEEAADAGIARQIPVMAKRLEERSILDLKVPEDRVRKALGEAQAARRDRQQTERERQQLIESLQQSGSQISPDYIQGLMPNVGEPGTVDPRFSMDALRGRMDARSAPKQPMFGFEAEELERSQDMAELSQQVRDQSDAARRGRQAEAELQRLQQLDRNSYLGTDSYTPDEEAELREADVNEETLQPVSSSSDFLRKVPLYTSGAQMLATAFDRPTPTPIGKFDIRTTDKADTLNIDPMIAASNEAAATARQALLSGISDPGQLMAALTTLASNQSKQRSDMAMQEQAFNIAQKDQLAESQRQVDTTNQAARMQTAFANQADQAAYSDMMNQAVAAFSENVGAFGEEQRNREIMNQINPFNEDGSIKKGKEYLLPVYLSYATQGRADLSGYGFFNKDQETEETDSQKFGGKKRKSKKSKR